MEQYIRDVTGPLKTDQFMFYRNSYYAVVVNNVTADRVYFTWVALTVEGCDEPGSCPHAKFLFNDDYGLHKRPGFIETGLVKGPAAHAGDKMADERIEMLRIAENYEQYKMLTKLQEM